MVTSAIENNIDGQAHHHTETFISKYIFSLDHKIISRQFLFAGMAWAVLGGLLSVLFRTQLAWPNETFPVLETLFSTWYTDGILKPEAYNAMITMHGTIMIFFVLTASLTGTFANLLVPFQIGARDMASPLLNALSFWIFILASVFMLASLFAPDGAPSAGWTVYPPLSALPQTSPGSGLGMTLWLIAIALFIISTLMGGLNYISTILNMRTKGMTMYRMPLSVWALFFTAIVGLLAFPVLLSAAVLLIFDRGLGTSFFLSNIVVGGSPLPYSGGSPILFQHLFWFLGHPEVYIIILPAMGIVSEVLAIHSRKPVFGYKAMIFSLLGITIMSFLVWAHHMFVSGMNPFLGGVFTVFTLLIAIPSSIKVFNWLTTLWRGNFHINPASIFAVGFVSLFISGGLTGIWLGSSTVDIRLHDTYFVIAHFHLVMGVAAFFGMFAGVYHWFPRMFGRMMNNTMGYIHFGITFVGAYLIFWPMHFMGLSGVPRRYYHFNEFDAFSQYANMNVIITVVTIIVFITQFIFIFNFFHSMYFGKKAPQNPWNATTLEWTSPVEGIHGNWEGDLPVVHRWPYDYSKPGADEDFIAQTTPLKEGEIESH
ncbi:MAG TPA: cbb3-type cytochrome c oxidase subunit I [Chitinophagales bacterium]|nr:cbb3-type cytochrome c oxidase subunit I [Chitinophagales bacterium]MCB0511789.1 cbb3-type cytochrome c oxidase subunit I [Bacteroidota bacterium]MCB9075137.1 cbb3-type cytochrome c oxidase subunit I [Chitinophagales bacterium]HMU99287.1 cbb3-type cytochrome c oxidase subunit I [Chitinophagales bacterium]HMW93559.1 cbb3-type cytochrome c oxidase subunit I [Chitinophagales bacterium]